MISIRTSSERGRSDFGWLDSKHTFSFGQYMDPAHMGFGPIRVINDDIVAGGGGFPTHAHADMEIITYVLDGALEHRDSLGNGSIIKAGDLQRMTAGRGIRHSEYNASKNDPVHFLQIWIVPEGRGLEPGYEQVSIAATDGKLELIASRDGRSGSVTVHQDVEILAARLNDGDAVTHTVPNGRAIWLHVARGDVTLNGEALSQGDSASLESADTATMTASTASEVLLIDVRSPQN
jgi:quercetin 2,3-dioxygenase